MKRGATVQTAPSSQWPRDLSAFAFLHQHDRTTSRQRSSRCNGGDVSTGALERRGNALPHIGKKRSYDGRATIMAQCCSAARMALVWCFHIWRLQLWSYSLLTFIIGSFFSLGAQLALSFVSVAPCGLTLLPPCCFHFHVSSFNARYILRTQRRYSLLSAIPPLGF
jgi:hypothetical protein